MVQSTSDAKELLQRNGYELRVCEDSRIREQWWRKGNYIGQEKAAMDHIVTLNAEIARAKRFLEGERYTVVGPIVD